MVYRNIGKQKCHTHKITKKLKKNTSCGSVLSWVKAGRTEPDGVAWWRGGGGAWGWRGGEGAWGWRGGGGAWEWRGGGGA